MLKKLPFSLMVLLLFGTCQKCVLAQGSFEGKSDKTGNQVRQLEEKLQEAEKKLEIEKLTIKNQEASHKAEFAKLQTELEKANLKKIEIDRKLQRTLEELELAKKRGKALESMFATLEKRQKEFQDEARKRIEAAAKEARETGGPFLVECGVNRNEALLKEVRRLQQRVAELEKKLELKGEFNPPGKFVKGTIARINPKDQSLLERVLKLIVCTEKS